MLSKLPREILLRDILYLLDSSTLIKLSLVSTYFNYLVNDEHIWKRLCFQEFNISQDNAFRYRGWKQLYIALKLDTKVFTWGENHDNRLGLSPEIPNNQGFQLARNPRFRQYSQVSEPQEVVSLEQKNIIDIVSGGWSFHALDTSGSVWMWGTMQQDITPRMSIGTKRFIHPIKLQEKNETQEKIKFRSISTGRGHVIGLARDGSVWHWTNHIMLQRVLIPLLENEKIVQVVANWNYSSVLTDKGALFIIPKPDLIIPSQAQVEPPPTQIVTPRITSKELLNNEDTFVQITGLDGYTLVLTESSQVVNIMTSEPLFFQDPQRHVHHLKAFSAIKEEKNTRDMMKRFITGNFDNFAVYTTEGQVLLGKLSNTTEALILPDLQHKNICKVSFGDYHCGALTNDGQLYTWGNFSSGALGHGTDHLESHQYTPTLVEALNNMFVFAIGFGGWQSSVLAIPLQENYNSSDHSNNNNFFERTDV